MTNFNPVLADGPINDEIHVFHNSEWARTFEFRDVDTREVRDLSDISFFGSVSYEGTVIVSFVFTKPSDTEVSINLPVARINSLDSDKCYDYDWFLVEDGISEVFAKSKLKKFQTSTVLP
jgi:hypothetical protein